MTVILAPAGLQGFDCYTPVSIEAGRALHALGHRFAVRYVGREKEHSHDLSDNEIADLFAAGLGLMVVQHVESAESWLPTMGKAERYGKHATEACLNLGIPQGTTIWCDLEGVDMSDTGAIDADVANYCNTWFEQVEAQGFQPGLYVGWHSGLTAHQLFHDLRFTRYWAAYNLNRDEEPAVRGVCMKQRVATPAEKHAVPFDLDGNTIKADAKGDLPSLYCPDEWDPS